MKTYLLFKDGKLVTVIQTKVDNAFHAALSSIWRIEYDYLVEDPQDAEKQIAEWKQQ